MSTGAEHYRRAEELLAQAGDGMGEPNAQYAAAQVHATLALAYATDPLLFTAANK